MAGQAGVAGMCPTEWPTVLLLLHKALYVRATPCGATTNHPYTYSVPIR